MNRRTRLFLLGASALLCTGIATAGMASFMGFGRFGLMAADGADALAYIPPTVQLVGYMDVRHLLDSELRHKLHPDADAGTGASRLLEETGINVETDVDSVVMAALEGDVSPAQPPLIIAKGRFDAARVEAAFRARGGTVSDHQGTRMLTNPDRQLALAFLETELIAAGAPAAVRTAIETGAANAATVRDNAEVMRLVERVDDSDAWTVARFDALRGRTPLPQDLATQLPSITWLAAGGQIANGVAAVLHAETRDEQAAQDLREVIRGFVALVRMQVGQQAEFAEVMNSVELSGDGTTVSLAFSLPSSMIDRLSTMRPRPPADGLRTPARTRPNRSAI